MVRCSKDGFFFLLFLLACLVEKINKKREKKLISFHSLLGELKNEMKEHESDIILSLYPL